MAGTYIDAPEVRGFAGTFRAPPATALCSDVDRLEALAPAVVYPYPRCTRVAYTFCVKRFAPPGSRAHRRSSR